MLQRYCELDVDDFVGGFASLLVTGEPWEVALVAQGLLGDHVMRTLRIQHYIQNDAMFPLNGIIPSDTMMVARAVGAGYELIDCTKIDIRISDNPWNGNAELYIEASADEIRRLNSMLTTDEGWYS